MAEAPPSRKSKTHEINDFVTESDMEAAQQLIQLSDEDSSNNTSDKRNRRSDEEVDQRLSLSDITSAKIREIFGEDEVFQPKKQRRYRSLVNIYMATRPVNA